MIQFLSAVNTFDIIILRLIKKLKNSNQFEYI